MTERRRFRIVYLINDLKRAGAETQLVRLATSLDRSSFDPRIILVKSRNDFAEELSAAGVPVAAAGRRGWADLRSVWRLHRLLQAAQADVLHSFLFFSNLLAALLARRAGARLLILSQRCSYEAVLNPFWRRVARWSHRRADRVIVNSPAALQEELAAGYPADKIAYVANGVPALTEPMLTRSALGLPEGNLVVAVGQLDPRKGHRDLLTAWAAVRRAGADAHLILVGDGPLRAELEARALRLGLHDSVSFLGFRSPALPFIASSDVLVQPSLTEGLPNAVLEAMALGRPVVATRTGGIPELVVDGETGLLVQPGDSGQLATALTRLLCDPALRSRLGGSARHRAAQRFSVDAMIRATESVYSQLLESATTERDLALSTEPTDALGRRRAHRKDRGTAP